MAASVLAQPAISPSSTQRRSHPATSAGSASPPASSSPSPAPPSGPAPDVGADELGASCSLPSSALSGLRLSHSGGDVLLRWDAPPEAPLYNVWYVTDAADGDRTRLADSPPAIGVTGCSEPSPATGPGCADAGAVGRGDSLHFYRVRSTCGGATEGP